MRAREDFRQSEQLSSQDMEIIEYLDSVVKEQQEAEMFQVDSFLVWLISGIYFPLISVDGFFELERSCCTPNCI
jgi:hypothetical protein